MLDLNPITPLGATTLHQEQYEGLMIGEVFDRAMVSISSRHGRNQDLMSCLSEKLDLKLPGVSEFIENGDFGAFWTASDQWMFDAPHDAKSCLADKIKEIVDDAASVTDQTDGWCRFRLSGPRSVEIFQFLCTVDVSALVQGQVVKTLIEHTGCFVLCRQKAIEYEIIGPVSVVSDVLHALQAAARTLNAVHKA
ncbi:MULTISPECIES: sarcosine oxidase subunit gamma [unclassified Ruegeria]|uniref:sarcosine oxidase subunit gamma n=1 Tax=unclassified Ruegeria TaxID=2625375 RepID=UPI00148785FC|nr:MULTISPECIES: sarcosine oxidase subunit gamma [unclassified Ruegeria]NOD74556.1 sarcosine oxidase subunit gamma [Ruegeria sp. HKCCD4332]NOD88711.1 sarcosine oxidase subunit gamma [Ruegeria sp. HKCCD4318]NOE12061.1 sarcosine oxidase subunit gamma [Ruegeria sp. HKCCD4318-2]NOG09775.1 sarcosine oxidase subunit gamma [Ruegeria sp. HKCCD4315]